MQQFSNTQSMVGGLNVFPCKVIIILKPYRMILNLFYPRTDNFFNQQEENV